jgi:hypothetical protein
LRLESLLRSAGRECVHYSPYPLCMRGTRLGRGRKYLFGISIACYLLISVSRRRRLRLPPTYNMRACPVRLLRICKSGGVQSGAAGAVVAGGFALVLDKHTPQSSQCAPAAFRAEGPNASTPKGRLEIACTSKFIFEGRPCTRYRIHVLSRSKAIWGAQRRASDPRSRDCGQGKGRTAGGSCSCIHPDRGSQILQD